MHRIDKFVGNIQDKYCSKCVITNFDFHFDTQENNLDFAYYCLMYHLKSIMETNNNDTEETVTIGSGFGFHYHIEDTNQWWYFEVKMANFPNNVPLEDILDGKVKIGISMSSSTLVVEQSDINTLNLGFN